MSAVARVGLPGFYPYARFFQRYWDGQRWTDEWTVRPRRPPHHDEPAPAPAPAPAPEPEPAPEPPQPETDTDGVRALDAPSPAPSARTPGRVRARMRARAPERAPCAHAHTSQVTIGEDDMNPGNARTLVKAAVEELGYDANRVSSASFTVDDQGRMTAVLTVIDGTTDLGARSEHTEAVHLG